MSIQQVFVRKKPQFDCFSSSLENKLNQALHIDVTCTVYYMYEIEGLTLDQQTSFQTEILGDKVTDIISNDLDLEGKEVLAYTYMAGQFDQRAHYAKEAGKLLLDVEEFTVRSSTVIVFDELLEQSTLNKIKRYLINPVDTKERAIQIETQPTPITKELRDVSDFPSMTETELNDLKMSLGLFMDLETLIYIQSYYKETGKIAKETELFLFDTYWSDHCRHTTFFTTLTDITVEGKYETELKMSLKKYLDQRDEMNRTSEITLMDLATHNARYLKHQGKLQNVEESDEINACSVYVEDQHDSYLLMFKNETHNHPTEIEPFGGAQTCLGGAIRDPLSGRSFVYQGIRISGAENPLNDVSQTMNNKLPQSTICRDAARGFSSYGNQIGLATTFIKELYHPSYVAKHFELGAVVGISKASEVIRMTPEPGDYIYLLGGKTGKDGIGGASGSSVSHTKESLDTSYAQIQKGNPLEERKLQRLFKIQEVKEIIKRSNDFGAGGVSVAIGELADGVHIDLDKVPLKTSNMNPTEIAISESQERMAVVISPKHEKTLLHYAQLENVQATHVATVTDDRKVLMRYNGKIVVDIDRDFLDTNGPLPTQSVSIVDYHPETYDREVYKHLNQYSQKGLAELFDCSVGYSTLYAPFGGVTQRTPELGSVQRFPVHPDSNKASVVTYGFDPLWSEESPYRMGMYSVLSSVAKILCLGGTMEDVHLSFQEYFPKLGTNANKWGMVLQTLLGAFEVCDQLGIAPIGGKDSMSGTYESIDVIPTLVSFAFGQVEIDRLKDRALKKVGEYIYLLPLEETNGLPNLDCFLENVRLLQKYNKQITAVSTTDEGVEQTLQFMSLGNKVGYELVKDVTESPCGFLFTTDSPIAECELLGVTKELNTKKYQAHMHGLEKVYPYVRDELHEQPHASTRGKRYYRVQVDIPKALIMTFSGTNSEMDMEKNFKDAGAETEVFVVNDSNYDAFKESVERFSKKLLKAHILVLPGGFSFSDEPDGSGKYIATFLKNKVVKEAIEQFLSEDKLILGICNGFQGLIKSGLLPYGEVQNMKETDPTLFFNKQNQHVSKLVETAVASTRSPWLQEVDSSLSYTLPVSHSEGCFVANEEAIEFLNTNDLIATTYLENPNGSVMGIEGLTSPSGNILGKMAHNERSNNDLFLNIPGNKRQDIFSSGVNFFKKGGRSL